MAKKKQPLWQKEAEAFGIPYHFRKKEDVVNAIKKAKMKASKNTLKGVKKETEKIKIIILGDDTHKQDIIHYEKFLNDISEKIELYILGLHIAENEQFINNIKYNYIKPASIISLFKQIKEINADLVFIPLIFNEYNMTSSDYILYMVAPLFDMPIFAPDFYPFNEVIKDGENGFLYAENNIKESFDKITLTQIKEVAYLVKKSIMKGFSLTKENVEYFLSKFA